LGKFKAPFTITSQPISDMFIIIDYYKHIRQRKRFQIDFFIFSFSKITSFGYPTRLVILLLATLRRRKRNAAPYII